MTKEIRVLVVDDSAFMRKTISGILNMDPDINIVGTAPDGNFALKDIEALNPDVITLDVEMGGMDGITTLKHVMERFPKPVIMVSALTKEGAEVTLNALNLGAVDFLQKPSGTISIDMKTQAKILIEKVKAAALIDPAKLIRRRTPFIPVRPKPTATLPGSVTALNKLKAGIFTIFSRNVVAIGVSTGGPQTLLNIFPEIPADIPAAILIVQHMPPTFTQIFAKRLDSVSQVKVIEASDGDVIEVGTAYLAPGDFHMTVETGLNSKKIIRIKREPFDTTYRPSVDVMMESVAKHYGKNIVGVILTGMGHDGAASMLKIKAGGGKTIAEDESTAVIFGMPKSAIKNNCIDHVLPYHDIAKKISDLVSKL